MDAVAAARAPGRAPLGMPGESSSFRSARAPCGWDPRLCGAGCASRPARERPAGGDLPRRAPPSRRSRSRASARRGCSARVGSAVVTPGWSGPRNWLQRVNGCLLALVGGVVGRAVGILDADDLSTWPTSSKPLIVRRLPEEEVPQSLEASEAAAAGAMCGLVRRGGAVALARGSGSTARLRSSSVMSSWRSGLARPARRAPARAARRLLVCSPRRRAGRPRRVPRPRRPGARRRRRAEPGEERVSRSGRRGPGRRAAGSARRRACRAAPVGPQLVEEARAAGRSCARGRPAARRRSSAVARASTTQRATSRLAVLELRRPPCRRR